MDKEKFKENLENKKFYQCIKVIRKEIIEILCKKIKEKDKFFSYSTTKDLYLKSKDILTKDDAELAYTLYNLDIMDESDEYVLNELLEIYSKLK